MKHGSLFSGIGGFDLAAEWMGWENIFHCECNDFGKRILKYYWPKAISYDDITKTDFSIHRGTIDILTGGFPCQPYSTAGKRKGKEDNRHLWPEMLRAIREIQPCWVVGENVRGLTNWNGGLVFDEVQADLETEGYEVLPFLLPACAVGADHRRDRIWFISRLVTDTGSNGRNSINKELKEGFDIFRNGFSFDELISLCSTGITSNTNHPRLQRSKDIGRIGESWTESNEQPSRFFRTRWEKFPTQPPIRDGNDGLPTELDGITLSEWIEESIKGGGNAIVPQEAFEIFKAIEQYELLTNNKQTV